MQFSAIAAVLWVSLGLLSQSNEASAEPNRKKPDQDGPTTMNVIRCWDYHGAG